MEHNLLFFLCVIAAIAWLGVALNMRRDEPNPRVAKPFLVAGIALPALVFLADRPWRHAFIADHGFGWGFLIGGLAGAAALFSLSRGTARATEARSDRRPVALASACFLAAASAIAPSLWFRSSEIDALLGVAIGWISVTLTLLTGMGEPQDEKSDLTLLAATVMAFSAAACTAVCIAEMRGPVSAALTTDRFTWAGVAACWAFAVPVAILVAGIPSRMVSAAASRVRFAGRPIELAGRVLSGREAQTIAIVALRCLVACVVGLGLGLLLAHQSHTGGRMVRLAATGMAASLLISWLCGSRSGTEAVRQQNGAVAAIVALLALMLAYEWMAGMGIAIMLLGAFIGAAIPLSAFLDWPVANRDDLAPRRGDLRGATRLAALLLFMAGWALFRLFTVRYSAQGHGVGVADLYALFGIVLGVLLPAALAGYARGRDSAPESEDAIRLARLALAGAILLATPGLLMTVWGMKLAVALLIGLALGIPLSVVRLEAKSDPADSPWPALLPALLALACVLAICQWTGFVLPHTLLTRAVRIRLILRTVGGIALLMLIADYGARALARTGAPARIKRMLAGLTGGEEL
jgi:hypothetical protein